MSRRKPRAVPAKLEVQDPTAREVIAKLRAGAVVPPALLADVIEGFVLALEAHDRRDERVRNRVAVIAATAEALGPSPSNLSRWLRPTT